MTALAWLGIGALTISALYVIAGEMVRDAVDHALYTAQPAEDDWLDEVISLDETPMFHWLASENPGAIDSLAAAEASRADWSQIERWTR